MLNQLASEVQTIIAAMKNNFFFALQIVGVLWIIHIFNFAAGYRLNFLGIQPRTATGIFGIPFTPFLHGNFTHLFFNTVPLLALTDLMLMDGRLPFYKITAALILSSGFLIWLLGKRGIHIGASSLIMGYLGYLLARAYFNLNGTTFILAGVSLYYFGGLLLSVFPSAQKNISWEGHIFGLLTGIGTAYYLPHILAIH